MDLDRLLQKCRRDGWSVGDLDFSRAPPPMDRDREEAIVQYFTDMAVIERVAAALFVEQGRRAEDPVLREIFATFVQDELRHAQAAQMLADHYDVHHYRVYQPNASLVRFFPHFVHAVRFLSSELANIYVTTGELILDVALLRSLDDYVGDVTAHEVMERINGDESRHIAVDFHMVEYYASEEYAQRCADEPPRPLREELRAWWAFANVLRHARPFFRDVFFRPMARCDPSGVRIRQAFKRMQLLASKPRVRQRPVARFLLGLQSVHNHPVLGVVFGRLMIRVLGCDSEVLQTLYTDAEYARASTMSFEDLAAEAVALKHAPG